MGGNPNYALRWTVDEISDVWQKESDSDPTELESPEVAMIPVMVELSQILRTASQDIYHDSTGRSVQEKSQIGFQLEELLTAWKNKLPSYLNIDSVSLNDAEWASKQKLVLRMRKRFATVSLSAQTLILLILWDRSL